MRYLPGIFLFILISTLVSKAQILKGKIINQAGYPIQYATVYIQELKQGTTSNTRGDYEIKLPAGKYTVIYQNLGFQPVYVNITLTEGTVTKDIVLTVQYYEIPEVRITATGEDPAYIIMRKVIGLAPYYLNNVSYYKADVYLKGNLVIKRIPRLLQKSMKIESSRHGTSISASGKQAKEEKTVKAGDTFLMESVNEIEFTAPKKYIQKVTAFNSTFPEQGNEISPMDFIQASFYQPVLADMAISPLSPAAFSHYNYRFLGASLQGNFTIDKIEVIPKHKSQQLFYGIIYIIEDLWCLHSVDLTNENLVGKVRIQQLYVPVQDDIWMPVSHKFDINIDIIGFRADAFYGSSVKYIQVKPNLSLQRPKTISTDYKGRSLTSVKTQDTTASKTKKQINKILEKEELTNRDMVKLSRLIEKESEKSSGDSSKKNLEVKENTTHVIEKDAGTRDSAYWAGIRPIPLSDIEIHSLRQNDSIKAAILKEIKSDTVTSAEKNEKNKYLKVVRQIALGHTWSDSTGSGFTYGGLINSKSLSFNPVDGFIYGMGFTLSKSWKNNKSLSVYPDFSWAFSRRQFMWRVNTNYNFNGLKQRQLYIRTGITSKDISNGGSINLLLNSEASLFFKKNYLRLYDSRYLTIGYRTEIINGLTMELSATYEDRTVLQNTTDFSIFNSRKEYSDNIPVNSYLTDGSNHVNALRDQKHTDFVTKFTYIPFQMYRITRGNKIPLRSDWPTFSLTWQHGLNKFSESSGNVSQFDMIKFEANRSSNIGAFSEFRWRIRSGGFFDNRSLTFFDFSHFNSQPVPFLFDDYQDAFMLPAYYSMSTPEFYGEAHLKYTTSYLLLKLLPLLSNTLMRENLSLSYLGSRFHKNYTEVGYSISEFLLVGEIGVYIGFEDLKYKSIGGKLILRLN